MFRIFLTNLGKYNEGELVGEWVDLPCEDFDAVLKRIGVSDQPDEQGRYYEEFFITDYESDYGVKVHEYENLDHLNEVAELLEGTDAAIITALLEVMSDLEEAVSCYQRGQYSVYPGCDDMGDVARAWYEATGDLKKWEDGGLDPNAINWDYLGRGLEGDGTFIAYDDRDGRSGYVEVLW